MSRRCNVAKVLNLKDITSRYAAEAESRATAMLAEQQRKERLTIPGFMAQPGRVHTAIMEAVDQLLTMGLDNGNVSAAPAPLRAAVRGLRRMEHLMLAELAKVPEQDCLNMVRLLAARLNFLADSLEAKDDSPAPPVADQPPA